MAAAVELRNVCQRFGAVQALRDVSLSIAHGEFVALVGANGSGKTTLLRALHGQLAGGEKRPPAADAAGPRQAMVFQRPFLLRLSVASNLHIACWLAGVPRRQRAQRVRQALQRVGLEPLLQRPALSLSLGQQQRLALARALAARPRLLFLDEPTASLDPSAKKEVEALLAALSADGMTLVMSTHNLGQAKRLATRVVYLEDGEIHADLPTADFFSHRLQGRARQFLKGELAWPIDV